MERSRPQPLSARIKYLRARKHLCQHLQNMPRMAATPAPTPLSAACEGCLLAHPGELAVCTVRSHQSTIHRPRHYAPRWPSLSLPDLPFSTREG